MAGGRPENKHLWKSSPGHVVHHHSPVKEPLKFQFSGLKLDFISLPEPKSENREKGRRVKARKEGNLWVERKKTKQQKNIFPIVNWIVTTNKNNQLMLMMGEVWGNEKASKNKQLQMALSLKTFLRFLLFARIKISLKISSVFFKQIIQLCAREKGERAICVMRI